MPQEMKVMKAFFVIFDKLSKIINGVEFPKCVYFCVSHFKLYYLNQTEYKLALKEIQERKHYL